MSSTFGHFFRCTTFGESHGGAVGVVIDGCPPGHKIDLIKIQVQLTRRRPGQSHLTTPRNELDQVECLSGLANQVTLGSPICLIVKNKDFRQQDYEDLNTTYRPSHADYTTEAKYGVRAPSGGGRSSARETIGRVAAAALAEQVLENLLPGFKVVACVDTVKDITANIPDLANLMREQVDANLLRCPDGAAAKKMEELIVSIKKQGDSIGGTILCGISGCPAGLGEPIFDKLEADLAKGMMSLPASKGVEVGLGFAATQLKGSEHNDEFIMKAGQVGTATNRSGGIQGGVSNGELIYLRVAFKPVSTIFKEQKSVTRDGKEVTMKPKAGRHDPCVLPRAVPMVEAMATLTMMDHYLRQLALTHSRGPAQL